MTMIAWCVGVVQQVLQDTTRRLLEDLDSSGDSMIEFGEFKKHKKVRSRGVEHGLHRHGV